MFLQLLLFLLGDDGEKDTGVPHSDGRTAHGFAEDYWMGQETSRVGGGKTKQFP